MAVKIDQTTVKADEIYENNEKLSSKYLKLDGDSQNNTVTFTSDDRDAATSWTDVTVLSSKEKHSSILNKISTMFKNIRYLYMLLGTTDISAIGGGTVTGAISQINNNLTQKGNGKFVLTNGLQICWGSTVATAGIANIAFPVIYTATPVVIANMAGMNNNTSIIIAMLQEITFSNAIIRVSYYNGAQIGGADNIINWFAAGY